MVYYETPDDPEAFDAHYWDVHLPIAKTMPGLRSYRVSRNVKSPRGGDPFYLVAELEWDSGEDMKAAFASPEGKATGADVAVMAPGDKARNVVVDVQEY